MLRVRRWKTSFSRTLSKYLGYRFSRFLAHSCFCLTAASRHSVHIHELRGSRVTFPFEYVLGVLQPSRGTKSLHFGFCFNQVNMEPNVPSSSALSVRDDYLGVLESLGKEELCKALETAVSVPLNLIYFQIGLLCTADFSDSMI